MQPKLVLLTILVPQPAELGITGCATLPSLMLALLPEVAHFEGSMFVGIAFWVCYQCSFPRREEEKWRCVCLLDLVPGKLEEADP